MNGLALKPWSTVDIGRFKVTPIPVEHAPGSCHLYVEVGAKKIYIASDWKLSEGAKLNSRNIDELTEIGSVDALIVECVHVDKLGFPPPMKDVILSYPESKLSESNKKVVVTNLFSVDKVEVFKVASSRMNERILIHESRLSELLEIHGLRIESTGIEDFLLSEAGGFFLIGGAYFIPNSNSIKLVEGGLLERVSREVSVIHSAPRAMSEWARNSFPAELRRF